MGHMVEKLQNTKNDRYSISKRVAWCLLSMYGWRSEVHIEANVNSFSNASSNKNYEYPEITY